MQWDKKTGMSVIIAAIMIVSVIGFGLTFAAPAERLDYNGHEFVRTPQGLRTKINDVNLFFTAFPSDLEEIPVDEGAKAALNGARVLWFTYDPNDLASPEIADTLYYIEEALNAASDIYVQRGLLNNTGYVLPLVGCANATSTVPVLVMKSGNETAIKHENGCIIATTDNARLVPAVGDRLLYQMLEVMR